VYKIVSVGIFVHLWFSCVFSGIIKTGKYHRSIWTSGINDVNMATGGGNHIYSGNSVLNHKQRTVGEVDGSSGNSRSSIIISGINNPDLAVLIHCKKITGVCTTRNNQFLRFRMFYWSTRKVQSLSVLSGSTTGTGRIRVENLKVLVNQQIISSNNSDWLIGR